MRITNRFISIVVAILFSSISAFAQGGKDCATALANSIPIPFSASNETTCGKGNDYNNVTYPCNSSYGAYSAGEDYLYYFTAPSNGIINIKITGISPSSAYGSFWLLKGCPNAGGTKCSDFQTASYGPGNVNMAVEVKAGESYYIMADNFKYSPTSPGCIKYNISVTLVNFNANSQCTNADFETGSFSGWNVLSGKSVSGIRGAKTPDFTMSGVGIISGRHTIMTGGTDPCGGFPMVAPGGKFSARIGNNINGAQAEQVRQTFKVSTVDPTYTYRYAVVFQDPQHAVEQQPFFKAMVLDKNGNIIPCSEFVVSADENIPGFKKSAGFATYGSCKQVWYKSWTTVIIDLKAYAGQEVTAIFTAGDCSLGGHFGYAYLDGACFNFSNIGTRDTLCQGESKTLIAPDGYKSYQWSTGATSQSITVDKAGIYSVNLTSYSGCAATLKDTIEVIPYPKADFSNSVFNCTDTIVKFVNKSVTSGPPLKSVQWYFGNDAIPKTATGDSVAVLFTTTGKHAVQMIAQSLGGCNDTITKVIDIKPCRYTVLMDGAEICGSQCITLKPTVYLGNAPFTYVWSANSGAKPGDSVVTVCPVADTTVYQVTVTDALGAVTTDTAIVYKSVSMKLSASATPIGCQVNNNGTASVTVAGGKAPYQYKWSNGSTVSSINNLVSGTYGVRVTDALGCSDSISVVVDKLKRQFEVKTNIDSATICHGANIQLEATGASTYSWSPATGLNNTNGNQVNAYPTVSVTYTVIGEDTTGCKDTSTIYVKVLDSISVASSIKPATCLLNDGSVDLSVSGGAGRYTFNWSHAVTTEDALQIPSGTYSVTISDATGCSTTESYLVPNTNRNVSAKIDPANAEICEEGSIILKGSGASVYQWNDGPTSLGLGDSITVRPAKTTHYQVYVTDSIGCLDTTSVTVVVNPNPVLSLVPPTTHICIGSEVSLSVSGAQQYYWSDAGSSYTSAPSTRKLKPRSDQQYTVYGIDAKGCRSDTVNAAVYVHPLPLVDLGDDQFINRYTRITLSPKYSNDIKYYSWKQDTSLSCLDCPSPSVTIRKPSRFELKVTTEWGCESVDQVNFRINCSGTFLHVPNAFTPNNDGQNDTFLPVSDAAMKVKSMQIFDRWGNLIWKNGNFGLNDKQKGWDGTYRGQLVPLGTFAYIIDVICDNGESYFFKGTVTVIR